MGKIFDRLVTAEERRRNKGIHEPHRESVENIVDDIVPDSMPGSVAKQFRKLRTFLFRPSRQNPPGTIPVTSVPSAGKVNASPLWEKMQERIFRRLVGSYSKTRVQKIVEKKKMRRSRRAASFMTVPDEKMPPPKIRKPSEKEGWISPSYTQSQYVALNPRQLLANRCVGYLCGSYESTCYKFLRTHILQKAGEKGGTTIMITSAVPGEGKTLTSVNLALTIAKHYDQTVMLVDSDLQQQKVHEYLGYESSKGLTDYLKGSPLTDLIIWPGIEKLTVISGGKPVVASSELLSSPRMKDLVKDLKNRYPDRCVLFDVAPVLVCDDAMAFAPQVDYIVLIVRAGSTSIANVKQALALLPQEKVLGVVLNRAEEPEKIITEYYSRKKKGSA